MVTIDPERYDQWYESSRGRWIGDLEYQLLRKALTPRQEDSVIDIGCGSGFFTLRFAQDQAGSVVGLDPDEVFIEYARTRSRSGEIYLTGSGEEIPFEADSFDYAVSVTALCFVADQVAFLREMARVARKGVAVGLLNRSSMLWHRKGKGGGVGAYQGAAWHRRKEVLHLFRSTVLPEPSFMTAVSIPSGGPLAQITENFLPDSWPWGGFLLAAAKQ